MHISSRRRAKLNRRAVSQFKQRFPHVKRLQSRTLHDSTQHCTRPRCANLGCDALRPRSTQNKFVHSLLNFISGDWGAFGSSCSCNGHTSHLPFWGQQNGFGKVSNLIPIPLAKDVHQCGCSPQNTVPVENFTAIRILDTVCPDHDSAFFMNFGWKVVCKENRTPNLQHA